MVVIDADVMIEVLSKTPAVTYYLRNDIGAFYIVPYLRIYLNNTLAK